MRWAQRSFVGRSTVESPDWPLVKEAMISAARHDCERHGNTVTGTPRVRTYDPLTDLNAFFDPPEGPERDCITVVIDLEVAEPGAVSGP